MRDAFIRCITEKAKTRNDVFLLVGDIGFGVVEKFKAAYPNQFLNAGVAEQNMTGMAAGLASRGRSVFTYSIGNFPVFRCLEQIRNDVAYNNLPVTVVAVGAGLSYGTLGYSHHAIEDIAAMRLFPNMRVLSPADAYEVDACVEEILSNPQPTYLRLGKNGEPLIHKGPVSINSEPIPLLVGAGEVLILATGGILHDVMLACQDITATVGPIVDVFSVPQIKPMNLRGVNLNEYAAVITIEEHSEVGGFGSSVMEELSRLHVVLPVEVIGVPDRQSHAIGDASYLRAQSGLNVEALKVRILNVLERHSKVLP